MKKNISIIGGGPASLALSCFINTNKYNVTLFEQNNTLGKKLLVAGAGGLNITHSENIDTFIEKYTPSHFLKNSLLKFSNDDLQKWLNSIGIKTYVGSSKRVFPIKNIKPITVLNTLINTAKNNKVNILTNYTWKGWNHKSLIFETKNIPQLVDTTITVFALGGGSWPVTGSNDLWIDYFKNKNITCYPFQSSNCEVYIAWPNDFIKKHEGAFLKNIAITCDNKTTKGEIVLTKNGIEGGAIYAQINTIRNQLQLNKLATISIDLKPQLSEAQILEKLSSCSHKSLTHYLENKLNLTKTHIDLLKNYTSKNTFKNTPELIKSIKNIKINITELATVSESISTVGGICLNEVDTNFELKKMPNNYVIGEMLNWDAPTGGYLLQACFSMGYFLAQHLNNLE